MSFINIPWLSESLKKRALRYLLQRYLGHVLLEKLTLEQLSVDLYDGKGCIRDLALDVEGLNEELVFLPFKFVDGCYINQITCSVPWSDLLKDSCSLEIDGATLVCQITGKESSSKTIYESSYLSKSMMSSSMQMAEEIVQEEPEEGKFDGLEMMAQLIDSVLRRVKVIATNTSFTIKSMSKDNKAAQVEFKIKYLRCEEDVLSDEPEKQKNVNLNTPGIIDKLLTFEGVEVLIDGRCVCKLGGKHMIKIKANESRSDLQLYVGSPLMVIITSTELKQFVDVFSPPKDVQIKQNFSEKMMSSTDFARIEQQLHFDVMGSRNGLQAQTRNQSTWAGIGLHANTEATFLPLRRITDEPEPEESATSQFSFYIKIPGIWMCLLDRAETSPAFSVPLVNSNFASVNDYLDDLLGERSHLRLLALPIQMEVTFTSISLIVGDAMVLERCGQVLTPILYSEDYEEQISSPKYRCDIIGESVSLTCSTTACLTLDPTFLERLENYLVESSPQSSNTLAMSIQVSCDKVKAKVLFLYLI
ncbi:Autophagy-related protein 2 -like protein B [Halotydeus destructor]|nr:Autophagy-related protein 2 -like protein B [Halotydeus destructor]